MNRSGNQHEPEASASDGSEELPDASLAEDLSALIEDGQTYLTAELAYQKTRLSFASAQGKAGVILLLGALAFVHLALIALVVGLVFALMPALTPLGSTAVVTVGLLLLALLLGLGARKRIGAIVRAFAVDAP